MTAIDPGAAQKARQARLTIDQTISGYNTAWQRYDQLIQQLRQLVREDALAVAFGPGHTGDHPHISQSGHADPTSTAAQRLTADLNAHRAAWDAERRALERRCDTIATYLASLDRRIVSPNEAREIRNGYRTADGHLHSA